MWNYVQQQIAVYIIAHDLKIYPLNIIIRSFAFFINFFIEKFNHKCYMHDV